MKEFAEVIETIEGVKSEGFRSRLRQSNTIEK